MTQTSDDPLSRKVADHRDYRSLFDAIDVGFCIVEVLFDGSGVPTDFRYLEANPVFQAQSGLEHVVGRRMREIAPDHEQFWFEAYGTVAATGDPRRFQHEAKAVGRVFDVYAFRTGQPEQRQVAILFTDITARMQAETAMRESEERFRAFVTASADVVYRMSPDWSEMRQLVGRGFLPDTEEPSPTWLERYIYPIDWPTVREAIDRAIETKSMFQLEHRVRRADNNLGWTSSRAVPILDATGDIVEWLGTASDVTERRSAEDKLRRSEERFRVIVENARDYAIFTMDGTGRIETWLGGAETILGWTAEEIVGREVALTYTGEDRESGVPAQELDFARESGSAPNVRWHQRKDGSRVFIDGITSAIRGSEGKVHGFLKIGRDMTERHQAQERQGVLVAELQHRTRNLIGVVNSLASKTIDRSSSLDDFEVRFFDRLAALSRVQGLLSHLTAGDKVTFEELLRSELFALGAIDRGGVGEKVTLEGPTGAPLRSATVQTFALALHELATNAVKHGALGSPDGHLTVSWQVEGKQDGSPLLHVDWREHGVTMPSGGERAGTSGYGRELIERALPYQLGAETSYELDGDGVRCTIKVPLASEPVAAEACS